MFAYIPARGGSKRIPRKNVKLLGGKPLLAHVLEHLSAVKGLSGVAVSSEDPEILEVAQKAGAVTLGPREPSLADDKTGFLELLRGDAPRFSRHFKDDEALLVTATAALVTPDLFQRAVDTFKKAPDGLTMAVCGYERSPMLAMTGELEKGLTPIFPDMYLLPTKDLPACHIDAGCFYACKLSKLGGLKRLLDLSPILGVALPPEIGIDLDTPADWKRLEQSHAALER